jgi:nitrogen fixation/metabolism regulation signal transduction histidine kinase
MRYNLNILIRIALLVANILLLEWILGDDRLFFNQIILVVVLVVQVVLLIRFVNHTNRELSRFFSAIRHQDFSSSFRQEPLNRSFAGLQASMMEIIDSYKKVKIEKEAQYHFLRLLVSQIRVGIISLSGDSVLLINPTAEQLLGLQGLKSWQHARELNPSFSTAVDQIEGQGRKLVDVQVRQESRILAIDVSRITILDQEHRLITVHDINAEIEQKEIEAWLKLIRILTHEIMNSVTPISSLTETMQGMLTKKEGEPKSAAELNDTIITDIRFALHTIQHRSEGLLHFVDNYRKMTRVPTPVKEDVDIRNFIEGIATLMTGSLNRQGIKFTTLVEGPALTSRMDPTLIEQVLINLITNSAHAVEHQKVKEVSVSCSVRDHYLTLMVSDSGVGIPPKALKEIFVPFYSTKKQGSGIGLSLSKQIITLHGGTIRVTSAPETGTTFTISIPLS